MNSMVKFILSAFKRLFYMLFMLAGISVITFELIHLAPGDPAEILLGTQHDIPSPERLDSIRKELGLNVPFYARYFRWLKRAAVFDFGKSYRTGEPVATEILARLPATLSLAFLTFCFVVAVSVISGAVSAVYKNRLPDKLHRAWTILNISIPDYWMGLLLIFFFSLKLNLFPVMGKNGLLSYVLPVLTLGLCVSSVHGRVLRAEIIEIMSNDHVRFAYAKGLSGWTVFKRHVLRNALPPVVTLWGMSLGHLLGGAVIVETIFCWPGLGGLCVEAVLNRDFPLIQGSVLFMAFSFLLASQLVDMAYHYLNPLMAAGTRKEK